jgi:SHS2 domain-containing protein
MTHGSWELIPHGADVGVRGIGVSKAQAFEQAAVALTAVITDPMTVAAKECIEVSCEAPDDELLLVNWLNALIYEMATRKMLFGRFEVYLTDPNWGRRHGAKRWMPASMSWRSKSKARPARSFP